MLRPKQIAFVREYTKDWNATQAAIRAGYSPDAAHVTAFNLLRDCVVVAAIEDRMKDLAAAADLSAEWVLRQWKMIAEADPAELSYTQLECCRHCYGINREYQWVEFEYRKAVDAAQAHACGNKCEQPCGKKIPPMPIGGMGFNPHLAPVADCPECHGYGVDRVRFADVRRLKGSARRLYAGLKTTQHGVEIKMRDQEGALKNIAQYLGMLIDKKELSGPGGAPIAMSHYDAKDLTDNQLAQIIRQESEPVVESE